MENVSTSTQVRARIEETLQTRTAPPGTSLAKVEHVVKGQGARLWDQLKKRPSLGVLLAGGTGLGLAMAIGVGELAVAAIAGYAAYQVLRGAAPSDVAREMIEELEKL